MNYKSIPTSVDVYEASKKIVRAMILSPESVKKFNRDLGYLPDPELQNLAMLIIDLTQEMGRVDVRTLLEKCPSEEKIISKIVFNSTELDDAFRTIKISILISEADAYKEQLTYEMNMKSREILLNQYSSCLKELRRYLNETEQQNDIS